MTNDDIRRICARGNRPKNMQRRPTHSQVQRAEIHRKTGGRCHVCGGRLGTGWHADHIVPHTRGGSAALDNYLPTCGECNGLRGGQSPELLRLIMRLGVYAKHEIRLQTPLGEEMLRLVLRRLGDNRKKAEARRG
jgi:5-methylcytosine-specific restriction endonuclease McrA